MVPHIIIIDANTSAALATRSLIWHIQPHAQVTIVLPSAHTTALLADHIDVFIIDPDPDNQSMMDVARSIQATSPALYTVVLTSGSPARHSAHLQGFKVDLRLEKSASPAVLFSSLQSIVAGLARHVSTERAD